MRSRALRLIMKLQAVKCGETMVVRKDKREKKKREVPDQKGAEL